MEFKRTKRGGKRPGAGRPKGVRDRATGEQRASLEDLARTHTEVALNALVAVASGGESESARVGAAVALLDRGYGRPRQAVELSGDGGGPVKVQRIERVVIDPEDTDAEGVPPTSGA